MNAVNPVLARKLGIAGAEAPAGAASASGGVVPTAMRQMRRAVGRAADDAVSLSASVLGIADDTVEAEALIDDGPEGWVVLGLRDGTRAGLSGLFLLDPALRSALVDMQTMGRLLPPADHVRPVTRTDAVLCVPFADRMLKELAEAGFEAEGLNLAGYDIGPMDDLRTAGLVLLQGSFRSWRISVQMGGGEAQGEMQLALRRAPSPATPLASDAGAWRTALHEAVTGATARVDAELARMVLPLSRIDAFQVGEVLTLAGTTVGSVTLTGPDGKSVGTGRLGQVAGKRAVRLEPTVIRLEDDAPLPRVGGGGGASVGQAKATPAARQVATSGPAVTTPSGARDVPDAPAAAQMDVSADAPEVPES